MLLDDAEHTIRYDTICKYLTCNQNNDAHKGGAADLKEEVQNRIREQSERKKKCVPPLFQMWGVQATKYQ